MQKWVLLAVLVALLGAASATTEQMDLGAEELDQLDEVPEISADGGDVEDVQTSLSGGADDTPDDVDDSTSADDAADTSADAADDDAEDVDVDADEDEAAKAKTSRSVFEQLQSRFKAMEGRSGRRFDQVVKLLKADKAQKALVRKAEKARRAMCMKDKTAHPSCETLLAKRAETKALKNHLMHEAKHVEDISNKLARRRRYLRYKYKMQYKKYLREMTRLLQHKFDHLKLKYIHQHKNILSLKHNAWAIIHRIANGSVMIQRLRASLRLGLKRLREARRWANVLYARKLDLERQLRLSNEELARLRAKHNALLGRHAKLIADHEALNKALRDLHAQHLANMLKANAHIKRLEEELNGINAKNAAVDAALKACHASGTKEIEKYMPEWDSWVGKVDPCGIPGGDETTCQRSTAGAQCHAVGDPHFRNFDGRTFDIQGDRRVVLTRHVAYYKRPLSYHPFKGVRGGKERPVVDFEVQATQVRCNSCCSCVSGVQVRAAGHTIVHWREWGGSQIQIDGARRSLTSFTLGNHIRIGRWGSGFQLHFRGAAVHFSGWNAYVNIPARWRSGKSLTGLCGNADGTHGGDWVSGMTVPAEDDILRDPKYRRPEDEADEDLELTDDTSLQGPAPGWAPQDEAAEPTITLIGEAPTADKPIPFRDAAQKAQVEKLCASVHQGAKHDCMFDAVAGVKAQEALQNAKQEENEAFRKMVLRCTVPITSKIEAKKFPPSQNGEGFTVAFYTNATSGTILSRGDLSIEAVDGKVRVFNGLGHCTAKLPSKATGWTQYTVSVSKAGNMILYRDGVAANGCTAEKASQAADGKEMALGRAVDQGWVRHIWYSWMTVMQSEVSSVYNSRSAGPQCD